MKKMIMSVILATVTFGAIPAGAAEGGDLSGRILRSVIQGAVGPQEEKPALENRWFESVRSRMDAIDQRIDREVDRGDLSRREAREFKDELNDMSDSIDRMEKEGQVSQAEKDGINRELARLDGKIGGKRSGARSRRY